MNSGELGADAVAAVLPDVIALVALAAQSMQGWCRSPSKVKMGLVW